MSQFQQGFFNEIEKDATKFKFDRPEFKRQFGEKAFAASLPIFMSAMATAVMPRTMGTNPNTAAIIGGAFGAAGTGALMFGREVMKMKGLRRLHR